MTTEWTVVPRGTNDEIPPTNRTHPRDLLPFPWTIRSSVGTEAWRTKCFPREMPPPTGTVETVTTTTTTTTIHSLGNRCHCPGKFRTRTTTMTMTTKTTTTRGRTPLPREGTVPPPGDGARVLSVKVGLLERVVVVVMVGGTPSPEAIGHSIRDVALACFLPRTMTTNRCCCCCWTKTKTKETTLLFLVEKKETMHCCGGYVFHHHKAT